MAPNRRKNDHHGGGGNGGNRRNNNQAQNEQQPNVSRGVKCVRPSGCLYPDRLIYNEDVENGDIEVVRVTCNNLQCELGNYMHLECFTEWEQTVLNFLSTTGRARSWSVKQRTQNLWTKKGYDLAFKACDCKCGKGHLRKDLNWISPSEKKARNQAVAKNNDTGANNNANGNQQEANHQGQADSEKKKKKRSKAKENLPTLALSAPVPHPNDNHSKKVSVASQSSSSNVTAATPRNATCSSVSDNSDHGTQPWSVAESVLSAINRPRVNSLSSNASGSSMAFSGSGSPPSPGAKFGSLDSNGSGFPQNIFKFQRRNSNGIERIRHNSGSAGAFTGYFAKRTDFSSFNALPRLKLNAYSIKMEDDGHGNDDIRTNILSVLLNLRTPKVHCCVCLGSLLVYDRYPLIDGTFFISPRQHGKDSIQMPSNNGEPGGKYLSAVCMHCLVGSNVALFCRWCRKRWDGSSLVLGGCYSFDVFAATPCCGSRLQCTNCRSSVVGPEKLPNFFSDYSHPMRCGNCGFVDFHLAKPVLTTFDKYNVSSLNARVC